MNLAEGHTGFDRIILSIFLYNRVFFKRKKPPLFMVVTKVTKVYCRKFRTLVKTNEAQKHNPATKLLVFKISNCSSQVAIDVTLPPCTAHVVYLCMCDSNRSVTELRPSSLYALLLTFPFDFLKKCLIYKPAS